MVLCTAEPNLAVVQFCSIKDLDHDLVLIEVFNFELLDDLPADFRARYVSPSGKWLLEVFAKESLWDFEPLEHFTQQIQEVDPTATGKPFTTVEGLKSMKSGFQWAGLYAFIVIVVVLYVDFRGLNNTLIALTPLVMGVVLSLGIMALCGLSLIPRT